MLILTILKGIGVRTGQALLSILTAFDDLVCALLRTIPWVFFARARPSAYETISATLGWGAAHGYRWCAWLAAFVDAMPWFGKGHCNRAFIKEAANEFPL